MKSIPDLQVETSDSTGSSSSGGGGAPKVWTISGRVRVRESEIDGDSHDRPLKGIEVKVSASDIGGDGPWTEWGIVRTDADGDFAVSEANNGNSRFFRVQARVYGVDLVVEDGTLADFGALDLADRNWRTIWKSGTQREGPAVSVGTRVFASGQSLDLGDPIFRHQALIWYVLRTAIDRLKDEDPWFAIGSQTKALYPSNPFIHDSFNSASRLYLHEHPDDENPEVAWHPAFVLQRFMLMWHDFHTVGQREALRGSPNAHFAEGFSLFASNALLHELWGVRLERPLNRRATATELAMSTFDEIEDSDTGVQNALRLLRGSEREGWWSNLLGTAQSYPDNRLDDNGDGQVDHPDEVGVKYRLDKRQLPAEPHSLSLWDILRTFRANPAKGWDTDLDIENPLSSVLWFIDRAVDIHEISEQTRQAIRQWLDPLGTSEPYESLPTL